MYAIYVSHMFFRKHVIGKMVIHFWLQRRPISPCSLFIPLNTTHNLEWKSSADMGRTASLIVYCNQYSSLEIFIRINYDHFHIIKLIIWNWSWSYGTDNGTDSLNQLLLIVLITYEKHIHCKCDEFISYPATN